MSGDIPIPSSARPASDAKPGLRAIEPRRHLFCFGLGYSALVLARQLAGSGWIVTGTCRNPQRAAELEAAGYPMRLFDRDRPLAAATLSEVSHILVSVPPDAAGDPVRECQGEDIAALPALVWFGYLSTTSVYGDRGGGWVDESSALRPNGERGRRRAAAEAGWLDLWRRRGVPLHIFRLAAIYGPGRSPLDALRAGTARRVDKPGQVFSRIHVEDLARVLCASMSQPRPGAIYNVCDDDPAPPEAVVAHAAELIGLRPPPLVPFADAGLSPLARSFYEDNKRVRNRLIKRDLGVSLRYPDYRAGLAAILAAEA
ncbi:MAG: SDR family oxidoreductase [Stellaceae bacterium]